MNNQILPKSSIMLSFLYLLPSPFVYAEQLGNNVPTIMVEGKQINDVSGEEVKSADLAEALSRKLPNVSLIRRSGIANDIILRGQSKDNINVLIDGGKIYGACPNRMDPPMSHILTNNIESINIIEGPYDVENFGTLSGAVKVKTKKPEQEFHGEISANVGSWNYKKFAATFSGGNEKVRALVSVSKENSDQYKDGDGNNFAQQIKNITPPTTAQYKPEYEDLDAYDKKTFMGKLYLNLIDNHELGLSYTANRSDDVLYPSSKMDALYDDSNLLNIDYTIKNISAYSKELDFHYYDSDVVHPMSTKYRLSSGVGSSNERVSMLTTRTQGFKVKNALDLNTTTEMTMGLDTSLRNWDGNYIGYGKSSWISSRKSIDDVDTQNNAIFAEVNKRYNDLTLVTGARYDNTSIKPGGNQVDNEYNAFSAFLHGRYQFTPSTQLFAGFGKASRVPDARELYFKQAGMNPNMPAPVLGTPDLDDTKNYEIDFGFENNYQDFSIKTKLFYSWLKDYIYFNSDKKMNSFENIDASIYGFDVTGLYSFTDEVYMDFGLAYQRGKKNQALAGQTDTDLANITPLKLNLGLNYDYSYDGTATVEVVATDSWDNYDSDNGEQFIDSYAILNLKVTHDLNKNIEVTAGVDNLFDKTYAVNNTYKDLTLLIDGTGDVMLINEPGRYYYLNGSYKF